MERQRVGCNVERGCHRSGGHAVRSGLHQKAIDIQSVLLGKRRERCNGIDLFHISTIIELMYGCQLATIDQRKFLMVNTVKAGAGQWR